MAEQEVRRVIVDISPEGQPWEYEVGEQGVTKIELFDLPGPHCYVPHIAVWSGEQKVAEFCRHRVVGVLFR